jgi:U3 small nucleolar RNA-associated protein 25
MVKSNSKSKIKMKKKGPKGKKARAKAKLENQWGETVKIDQEPPTLKKRTTKSSPNMGVNQKSSMEREFMETSSQRVPSDEDSLSDGENAYHSLLNCIEKVASKKKDSTTSPSEKYSLDDKTMMYNNSSGEETDNNSVEESSLEDDESHAMEAEYDRSDLQLKTEEDPFSTHFTRSVLPEDKVKLSKVIQDSQVTVSLTTPSLQESLQVHISKKSRLAECPSLSLEDQWTFQSKKLFPHNRQILQSNFRKLNRVASKKNVDGVDQSLSLSPDEGGLRLSALQSVIYPALATYTDILITAETVDNRDALHVMIALHVMNHILTSRGRVQRNNKRLRDLDEAQDYNAEKETDHDTFRDQGYTRPTVLILLPTRGVCHRVVHLLLRLLGDSSILENEERFESEYGPIPDDIEKEEDDDDDDQGNDNHNPKSTEAVRLHRKSVLKQKGKEWNEMFGDNANSDDQFKLGIAFSQKVVKADSTGIKKSGVGVRLFTDFYKSDIILASPLAMKLASDGTTDDDSSQQENDHDVDYLTSIEICILGYCDVLLMQNWDHVNTTLGLLNQQPRKNNDTDFSRVREYLLAGQAKHWRQLIFVSPFLDPSILSTFKRSASSHEGIFKLRRRTLDSEQSLLHVMVSTKQVFQRIPSNSFRTQGEDRLEYFEKHVLPQIQRTQQKRTMIYIPSYFEYISLRNLLLRKEIDFVSVTEYSRLTEVTRGRSRFLQGRKSILLYTGRAHFFYRHCIKGARHVLFMGLPEHFQFYSDIVNMIGMGIDVPSQTEDDGMEILTNGGMQSNSSLALFTPYEAHALERICGKSNAERMLQRGTTKSTFLFMS